MAEPLKSSFRIIRITSTFFLLGTFSVLYGEPAGSPEYTYQTFTKALDVGNDQAIRKNGEFLLTAISQGRETDKSLKIYKSKIAAAEFLAHQMISQLGRATRERMVLTGNEILKDKKSKSVLVIPAKEYFESASKVFSMPISTSAFSKDEKGFLVRYYNYLLRSLTAKVGKAGMALAVVDPDFKGTYDYILVLPLLHAPGKQPVSVEVLPNWLCRADSLNALSDSCLLHFGLPYQAMQLAREASQAEKKPFSEKAFYESAVSKCGREQTRIAVDCLKRAIECVPAGDKKADLPLEYKILQQWWDGGNYLLATNQAREIMSRYSDLNESAKAVEYYYNGLANSGNADGILSDIDQVLTESRYAAYKPQLLFIKWWALRRKRDQTARLAATEEMLLTQYGENPIVAPVLFSRAMDYLSNQDYPNASKMLEQVVSRFPSTKSAEQAKRIVERLKNVKNN